MSNENLPAPPASVGIQGGGATDSIIAQFYREAPSDTLNLHINIPSSSARVLLNPNAFNLLYASNGATFPSGSIMFNNAGIYLHTVTIYGCSDKNGIISVDIVNESGASYNPYAFSLKNVSAASTDPLILTTIIQHEVGQTARLRFGGASDDDTGLDYSIWSIAWAVKK